jgi:hypothetical protein
MMRDPASECSGKTVYASKGAAIVRIRMRKKMRRSRRNKGWFAGCGLMPYRCPHCHGWHIGSSYGPDARRYD